MTILTQKLQECINAQQTKSKGTIGNMKALIKGMYSYAFNNDYVGRDITDGLIFKWTESGNVVHIVSI